MGLLTQEGVSEHIEDPFTLHKSPRPAQGRSLVDAVEGLHLSSTDHMLGTLGCAVYVGHEFVSFAL